MTATDDFSFDLSANGWQSPASRAGASAGTIATDAEPDTREGAATVKLDTTVNGTFDSKTDSDFFKLTLAAGTSYTIVTNGILDSNGPLVWYQDGVIPSSNSTGHWTVPNKGKYSFTTQAAGDYYVSFRAGQDGDYRPGYTFTVSQSEDDFLAVPAGAGKVTPNSPVSGTLETSNDRDWFATTLDAGSTYWLTAARNSVVTVFNQDGVAQDWSLPSSYATSGKDAALTFVPRSSGAYYVEVGYANGFTGRYTLNIQRGEADDFTGNPARAGYVNPNTVVSGRLQTVQDEDAFKIAVTKGKTYVFSLKADGTSADANLLFKATPTADVHEIDDSVQMLVGGPRKTVVANYTGDMYLTVKNAFADGTPGYAIDIRELAVSSQASAGNDMFIGRGLGDRIDGGAGIDTTTYLDTRNTYTITQAGGQALVQHNATSRLPDTLAGIERLQFEDVAVALDTTGAGGQAYRLYQAAFNRAPDKAGIGYWIAQMDKGAGIYDVAQSFINSTEFSTLHGATPSDAAFIGSLYQNVLHRAGDQPGVDYWTGVLASGVPRAAVLASFSESPENQAAVLQIIGNGFEYTPYG